MGFFSNFKRKPWTILITMDYTNKVESPDGKDDTEEV